MSDDMTDLERQVLAVEGQTLVWSGGRSRRCDDCNQVIKTGERYQVGWKNREVLVEDFIWFHVPECPDAVAVVLPLFGGAA
jgi:hypothetical protein